MINKKIEIKFDVNWIDLKNLEKLNETLNNLLSNLDSELEKKGFAVCNLICKSKEY